MGRCLVGKSSFITTFGGSKQAEEVEGDLGALPLLAGFVAGYGGWLAQGTSYALSNAGCLAGRSQLVQIAQRDGASQAHLPTAAGQTDDRQGAAMYFDWCVRAPPPGWSFARFPRLPVDPVVPVQFSGVWLVWENPSGTVFVGGPHHDAAEDATLSYALWQYGRVRQDPLADLPAPVVADAALQGTYWSAPLLAGRGATAVGDWSHFLPLGVGWPPLGSGRLADPVYEALSTGAAGQGGLQVALTGAGQKLNRAPRPRPRTSASPRPCWIPRSRGDGSGGPPVPPTHGEAVLRHPAFGVAGRRQSTRFGTLGGSSRGGRTCGCATLTGAAAPATGGGATERPVAAGPSWAGLDVVGRRGGAGGFRRGRRL